MIIFRTADDMMAAIHVAQVFDKHGLCVVSMGQVIKKENEGILDGTIFSSGSLKTTWLVVGQGTEADISQINADIADRDTGYSEEESDDGLGSDAAH